MRVTSVIKATRVTRVMDMTQVNRVTMHQTAKEEGPPKLETSR